MEEELSFGVLITTSKEIRPQGISSRSFRQMGSSTWKIKLIEETQETFSRPGMNSLIADRRETLAKEEEFEFMIFKKMELITRLS